MLLLYKIIFISFDQDRSKTLDPEEAVNCMIFCKKLTIKEAVETVIMIFGVKKLKITQMYCILTDKIIIPDIDPYDGMLERRKTSCCEII
jgi:hypothetical protein